MRAPNRAAQWLAAARQYQPDVTRFLQDLVRLPSVNGRDSEAAVAGRIADEARRLGLQARLIASDPARPNMLVEWGTGPAGFLMLGHMDTVAEGQHQTWTHPPFEAIIEQGNLYGRGSADNKAGIACGLYTLALLRDHEILDPQRCKIMLAGVVDEESGASSKLGVRYLLDQGMLSAAHGAIYTYTSDIVCIGHRGLLRIVARAAGKSVHTGSMQWSQGTDGVNAVTGLAEFLLRLEKLNLPAPKHPAFKGLRYKLTPGTIFLGGDYESMVPASAEAMIDVRLMPGQSADGVIQSIHTEAAAAEIRRPGLKITLEIKNNLPGVALERHHPLVTTTERWTKTITGAAWPVAGAGPANEGYMLITSGIPTLCGFGPTGGNAHAPDEWVNLDSLVSTMAMYAGIIKDYLNEGRPHTNSSFRRQT